MWQRYRVAGREVDLFECVAAEYDPQGRLTRLEDCWRGVPLLEGPPSEEHPLAGSVSTDLFRWKWMVNISPVFPRCFAASFAGLASDKRGCDARFSWARRINGALSAKLTPLLVHDEEDD